MSSNFCPYCGSATVPGAVFCRACGRPLDPTARPASEPVAAAAPVPAPAMPPLDPAHMPQVEGDQNPRETEMTKAMGKAVMRAAAGPATGITQLFGALFGLGGMAVGLTALTGNSTLDPTSFTEFAIGIAVVALILGGVSKGLRADYVRAVRTGKVIDLRGIPETRPSDGSVQLGGIRFRQCGAWSSLRPERMNRIQYVAKGAARQGTQPILVLAVNETALSKAIAASVEQGQ